MDASTTAFLGVLIFYSGDWEYGLSLVERAMHLNPHHGMRCLARKKKAFDALERSIERRERPALATLKVDPRFAICATIHALPNC